MTSLSSTAVHLRRVEAGMGDHLDSSSRLVSVSAYRFPRRLTHIPGRAVLQNLRKNSDGQKVSSLVEPGD